MSEQREGDPVKVTFDVVATLMLKKQGSHPNLQIVVENWGTKIPKIRRFDLRFWGEPEEPGYAIRFERADLERIFTLIDRALLVPSMPKPRPWWRFWA